MNDFEQVVAWLERIERRVADHEVATRNMFKIGPVVESEHGKGVRLQSDDGNGDGQAHKEPWAQHADRSGASSYLPRVGETGMVLAPYGMAEMGVMLPFGHSDAKKDPARNADETVHHARDGQRHSVSKGHVVDLAEGKHSRGVGSRPEDLEGGSGGGGGGNLPHELNRQLQGLRAAVTQNAHNIAGLHDVTSQMRALAQFRIPELATLIPVLSGSPESLERAAQGILGKLEGYIAKSFQQMVGKLTNGLLDNVMGNVAGFVNGQVGGLISGMQDAVAAIEDGPAMVAGLLDEAAALAAGGVQANTGALSAKLGQIAALAGGTPAEAALAPLLGQARGALDAAGTMFAGLGGLVDAQQNLTKGMIKSYRLGGY